MSHQKKHEFEQLYAKYYSIVYGYILKRVLSIPQAEDLTMDIFSVCWEKFDNFDPNKASFSTWIYTITNNRLKNFYRDKKLVKEDDGNNAADVGFEDDILHAEYLTQMREELADALSELSETQRKIVVLKYFAEKNSNEIGEELGMTAVNVRVQLSRALKKLSQIIGNGIDDLY